MRAAVQFCFLLSFLLAFSAAARLPLHAQINGVPASVTSLGFGGSNNPNPGVRASVTSLGPNGYGNSRPFFGDCCADFFLSANPNPPLFSGHRHHRDRDKDSAPDYFPVGVIEPVYIPYAVPYAQEAEDDSADADYVHAPGARELDLASKPAEDRDSSSNADTANKPEGPVAIQPSTMLVFRDGQKFDVINYAIVGDTLFDFDAGRTRKILLSDLDLAATQRANDDRGVDFQVPANTD